MTNIIDFSKKCLSLLLSNVVPVLLCLTPVIWSQYMNSNFTSTKMLLMFLGATLSILHWICRKEIRALPLFPKAVLATLIVILGYQLITPVFKLDWVYYLYIFKFLAFATMVLYFYNLSFTTIEEFIQKNRFYIFSTASLIAYFSAKNYYLLRVTNMSLDSGIFISSFGNVNMLAEFLILSFPLLWVWSHLKEKEPLFWEQSVDYISDLIDSKKPLAWWQHTVGNSIFLFLLKLCYGLISIIYGLSKFVLPFLWLFFLLFAYSRSAYIGLILWPLLQFRDFKKRDYAVIVLAVSMYFVHLNAPAIKDVAKKIESTQERMSIYRATTELIFDHPLGIGIGTYVNELTPYMIPKPVPPQEFTYPDQPHSEFLKWTVQFGFLGLAFSMFFLGYIAYTIIQPFLQKTWRPQTTMTQKFLLGSFCTLFPQLMFQFPFENPASTVYMALLFAIWMLYLPRPKEGFQLTKKLRAAGYIFCMVSFVHTTAFFLSVFLESNYVEDGGKMLFACEVYPINIRSCYSKNYHLIKQNKMVEARIGLNEQFSLNPISGDYLRTLPLYFQTLGNEQRLCEVLMVYQTIYPAQIYYKQPDVNFCRGKYKRPLEYANPLQFREDYMKWLFGFLNAPK